jgi:hypothetical protein
MKISKAVKVMLIGSAVYVVAWQLLQKAADIQGALIYIGIAGIVGLIVDQVDGNRKWDFVSMAIMGAAASIIFNVLGQFAGWFTIRIGSVLSASLQQGVLTGLAWIGYRRGK